MKGINIFVSGGSHFPFSAQKCRCAECIIRYSKMGAKSLANDQHYYKTIDQKDEHETRDRYTLNLQDQSQTKDRNGSEMKWWPGKQPVTYTTERGPTFFQTTTDHITTQLYAPLKPLFPGIEDPLALDFNKRNSFSQLQTAQTVKGRETEAKDNGCHWPWSGNSDAFQQLQKQQPDLTNIDQSNPIKHVQDPRFTKHDNSDSIYHGWGNFLPANKLGRPESHGGKPIEQTRTRAYGFKQNESLANWWHSSSVSHCPVTTYASNNYQERSTIRHLVTDSANEERNLRTWGMGEKTSTRRFSSFGISDTFLKETDSESPQNHQSMAPQAKPHKTSESTGINYFSQHSVIDTKNQKLASPCSPEQLTHFGAKTICELNLDLQKRNPQEMMINQKEFMDGHGTKTSETREERIRNLKSLLEKQEKTLEILRYHRKHASISIDEKGDNIAFNGHSPSTDDQVTLPNSLEQRWLKNWNEEDGFDHISTKIKRRKVPNSHDNTKTEEKNQALSNAEFTAVEGLVRLSKD